MAASFDIHQGLQTTTRPMSWDSRTNGTPQFVMRQVTMNLLSSIRAAFSAPAGAQAGAIAPGSGQRLLAQLDANTRDFKRPWEVVGREADALPVNLDSLIHAGGPGNTARPLDANTVATGAVVMAAPQSHDDAAAVVEACVNHPVTEVIDLTTENLASGLAGGGMRPWGEENGSRQKSVHLRPGGLTKADALGNQAFHQEVLLDLKQSGTTRSQQLGWSRMPLKDGEKIDPGVLLAACVHIQARERARPPEQQDGAKVVFMDRNGGDLAGAFAAANAIFRSNDRTRLSARDVDDHVVGACALLRSRRSPDLFSTRPDILESLRQFAHLVIDRRTVEADLPAASGGEFVAPRETRQQFQREIEAALRDLDQDKA